MNVSLEREKKNVNVNAIRKSGGRDIYSLFKSVLPLIIYLFFKKGT
tara:strand:+ start:3037 stop:3174 length:138 start_codon:yes stop_codon:yes gene_type:complete